MTRPQFEIKSKTVELGIFLFSSQEIIVWAFELPFVKGKMHRNRDTSEIRQCFNNTAIWTSQKDFLNGDLRDP